MDKAKGAASRFINLFGKKIVGDLSRISRLLSAGHLLIVNAVHRLFKLMEICTLLWGLPEIPRFPGSGFWRGKCQPYFRSTVPKVLHQELGSVHFIIVSRRLVTSLTLGSLDRFFTFLHFSTQNGIRINFCSWCFLKIWKISKNPGF